jgi:hypothetical protein
MISRKLCSKCRIFVNFTSCFGYEAIQQQNVDFSEKPVEFNADEKVPLKLQ